MLAIGGVGRYPARPMHPPSFSIHQKLSDWPDCRLELRCCGGRSVVYPIKLVIERHGDRTFQALLGKLRCENCGGSPSPVHLLAGFARTFSFGAPPDWTVELVPENNG